MAEFGTMVAIAIFPKMPEKRWWWGVSGEKESLNHPNLYHVLMVLIPQVALLKWNHWFSRFIFLEGSAHLLKVHER
jgi:hypothetical protein